MALPLVVQGILRGSSQPDALGAIRQVFEKVAGDFSWLRPGDQVLVKVSLNSPDPYPATTSPLALRAVVEALRDRGARVLVGDMAGIEHVLADRNGTHRKSSRECFARSGMGTDLKVDFIGFEELGWEDGFVHFTSPKAASWPEGFYLTRVVNEVDHIVSLPRLSTHLLSGVTLGMKLAVGYLRDDSRMAFHRDGPFYGSMKSFARGSEIPTEGPNTRHFFERMTEVNLAVADRQRVILCLGTEAQVTLGPDRKVPFVGLRAYKVQPEVGLVFGSTNPMAIEIFGMAFLTWLYRQAPWYARGIQKLLMLINRQGFELGRASVWQSPFVIHGLDLGLGSADFDLQATAVPAEMLTDLKRLMVRNEFAGQRSHEVCAGP